MLVIRGRTPILRVFCMDAETPRCLIDRGRRVCPPAWREGAGARFYRVSREAPHAKPVDRRDTSPPAVVDPIFGMLMGCLEFFWRHEPCGLMVVCGVTLNSHHRQSNQPPASPGTSIE